VERFRVRIALPAGLALVKATALKQPPGIAPLVTLVEGAAHVLWDMERKAASENVYEFETVTTVLETKKDLALESKAVLTTEIAGQGALELDERVTIAVQAKGRLLKYLPSIYDEDDLMGRLLMLFESFLKPIEKQINTQHYYFDPQMTPPEFLKWLAAWMGMVLDEDISEQQQRKLLSEASRLYKLRGTRQGLKAYLEIITNGKVEISEHFSENFRLGPESYLGPGIALGKDNIPNTFGVKVKLPLPKGSPAEEEKKRWLLLWERKTQALIEAEKPVHSGYDLSLEYDPELA